VAAYLSGMVLTAAWLSSRLQSSSGRYRRATAIALFVFVGLSLGATLLLHFPVHAQPVLLSVPGRGISEHSMPLRRMDPTCRLRGWRALAADIDRLRQQLREQGIEPVLAGASWTMPGELAFYCEDHPIVYSLGTILADRRSQYDLWRPNPVADPETFAGRTFIVVVAGNSGVEGALRDLARVFDELEPARVLTYSENGQSVAGWTILAGHGFRGFALPDAIRH
jgi:pimeloyl-ACP methyl ester carboxylesterase